MKRYVFLLALAIGLLANASPSPAVRLPAILSDNMVLQQGMDVTIWGWGDPGEKITVVLAGQKVSTVTDKDGRWRVALKPMKAGDKPLTMIVKGKNTLRVRNILIGEVWVCAGQSNMEYSLNQLRANDEIARADHPQIRNFIVDLKYSMNKPLEEMEGKWFVCSPSSVVKRRFSAVGYFFACDLQNVLKVPVGLISNAVSATPAEAWTSRPALEAGDFSKLLAKWDAQAKNYNPGQAQKEHQAALAKWRKDCAAAKAAGKTLPNLPPRPLGQNGSFPAILFNGMVAPLTPMTIRGVIWYQGESNVDFAKQYRSLFPTLIRDWRQRWGQGDFPFLFVQIANYYPRQEQPGERSTWAELREAQCAALAEPNTAMAVAIDIGESKRIHPRNKQDVGRRLCLAALAVAYGKKLEYSGPLYKSMKVDGNKIRLTFTHTTGGLHAAKQPPLPTPMPGQEKKLGWDKNVALTGFAVAGSDRKFYWAKATIAGNDIIVHSDKVAKPVAVRYAWANNPICNLYNGVGLPASPFRTDDWADAIPKK